MAPALTLFLIGCLLQSALCREFKVITPQTIEVQRGSCVTIPCSFDVASKYDNHLSGTCKAVWKKRPPLNNLNLFDSRNPQTSRIKGHLTGDLRKKDCSTTLNDMQTEYSDKFIFRLECGKELRHSFLNNHLEISVRDDPPKPTVTPSTLKVKEGTTVTMKCSAPAPCPSHPPTLSWTSGLGDSQESMEKNEDKTEVKTSVLTFTASHIHHAQEISCTAVYSKQDGSNGPSVSTSLTADISFAPQILPSSDCTKTADQLNCSCETVGNPSPAVQWYLDGSPVSHSDKFVISKESLNDTGLRSFITMKPQKKDLSTLLCHSSNSVGSASQCFCNYGSQPQMFAESQGMFLAFITTVAALLVLICALLLVIRAQRTHHNLPKSTVAMSQHLPSGEGIEVPNTTEEDIYINDSVPTPADVAHPAAVSEQNGTSLQNSGPTNAEGSSKISVKNAEDTDVIYSTVTMKSQKKKVEDTVDMDQPGNSYLEEEKSMVGDMNRDFVSNVLEMQSLYDEAQPRSVRKAVECEYAQVKFKNKSVVRK